MFLEPRRVEYAAVGVVDLPNGAPGREGLGHLFERLANG
jgi:hypothetical protein